MARGSGWKVDFFARNFRNFREHKQISTIFDIIMQADWHKVLDRDISTIIRTLNAEDPRLQNLEGTSQLAVVMSTGTYFRSWALK